MYEFKIWQEAGWAALYAVGVYVLEVLANFELATDWRAWLGALAVGAIRAAAGAALARVRA